ncbi:uncharacterized protein M421DRAFT_94659 [Didymella exigua CBS 183.55]|uniref:Homeobox domain-containing protein n=1 Tax=Didymella exigua CBS 183.55 TaxID=1150837 RepID=A0A6A5RD00_9PLEO|nr:uncharacterized protein M421DRAFT_94659 [Didymella exigua CBS 183.55]KAF1925582.1 hypothetical protein M421DRAFT_94659 [Didymella exigua CBS 183.55]
MMLSPNNIPFKENSRASSTRSIDSSYGSCIYEDIKHGTILDVLDTTVGGPAQQQQQRQQIIELGIRDVSELQRGDYVFIKKEERSDPPATPHLSLCTNISNPSSPEPISPTSPSEVRRSHARRTTSKLPSQAIKCLTAWLDANRHHPYPSAETKHALAEACSITLKQVTTWFTNTRQRQLKSQKNNGRGGIGHDQTPAQASRKGKKKDYGRSNGASPIEGFLSPSRLSPCASISDYSSGEADNWQCTFCGVSLTAKSWRRHEETQHHPKSQWTCLAFGPRVAPANISSTICAFCDLENPDDDHFRLFHRIGECMCKPENERTFGRPDHLQQHARNFHKCEKPLSELIRDAWRKDGPGMTDNKTWTCGFCHEVLSTWDARATHIATHFKAGLTMTHWREKCVPQSTLPLEQIEPHKSIALEDLTAMGATFAGPSNYRSPPTSHAHIDSAQHQPLPTPTTTFMSVPTTIPDINIGPFCMYGNPIDTFDPVLAPASGQNVDTASADFGFVGVDEFGNPVYDFSLFHSW